MGLIDLFKIDFKKPILSDEDQARQEKRNSIKAKIKSCNSRLNSIITLEETDKIRDARIIARHFMIDLANLLLFIYDREEINDMSRIKEALGNVPDTELAGRLTGNDAVFSILEKEKIDEKEMRIVSDFANDYYNALEIRGMEISKQELKTPLDDYRKQVILQLTRVIVLVAVIAAAAGILITLVSSQFPSSPPVAETAQRIIDEKGMGRLRLVKIDKTGSYGKGGKTYIEYKAEIEFQSDVNWAIEGFYTRGMIPRDPFVPRAFVPETSPMFGPYGKYNVNKGERKVFTGDFVYEIKRKGWRRYWEYVEIEEREDKKFKPK